MTQLSTRLYPNPLLRIQATTFTGAYQAVGIPLPVATRIIRFKNNTTVPVLLSWDGVIDHDELEVGEFLLLDVSANREVASQVLEIIQNQQFYVLGAAGTGFFYISSYHAY